MRIVYMAICLFTLACTSRTPTNNNQQPPVPKPLQEKDNYDAFVSKRSGEDLVTACTMTS